QCLTLLVLYRALSLLFKQPIPFLVIFSAVPIFFILPKRIFYDALGQFLVACIIYAMAFFLHKLKKGMGNGQADKKLLWIVLMGVLTSALILTKQSTGVGTFVGCLLAFFLLPVSFSLRNIVKVNIVYIISFVGGFLLLIALISPLISVENMIQDVFLTGSEPKGGNYQLISNLIYYIVSTAQSLTALVLVPAFFMLLMLIRNKWHVLNALRRIKDSFDYLDWSIKSLLAVLFFVFSVFFVLLIQESQTIYIEIFNIRSDRLNLLLWIGLALLYILIIYQIFVHKVEHKISLSFIVPIGIISVFAAYFHNLSVDYLRIFYDNNPIIVISLFLIFYFVGSWPLKISIKIGQLRIVPFVLITLISLICWSAFVNTINLALACTETWPDVKYLDGAKMRPAAQGMYEVVKVVRENSTKDDEVLLLPNDVHVESWFDRKRPQLTSSIVFTDQYWDKYVDEDYSRIKRSLPKIIIIGPRFSWSILSDAWSKSKGVDRLIKKVQNELLPEAYELHESQVISVHGEIDYMDVYVRKDSD
ncbi:MAG: hypothetical protein KKA19_08955, partial [Candidatus Margulisbacteria bacterium]|nr:hypothetical protein [Candidatus Margulisiibacteriota bacterium]